MRDVVVVGASLAGVTAADTLRMEGYGGSITVVGDELRPPYARPPLSKGVLAGTQPPESTLLPALGDDVALRLGARVARLDLRQRSVVLEDGEALRFDGLVIASGARARSLARPGQRGEHLLRTIDDVLALRERLRGRPSVLIVGAGFLGMETASTCRALGLDVTVVDREPPLRRVLGDYLAQLLTEAALDSGVRIAVCEGNAELLGSPDVRGVRLSDGRTLTADVVVSAVGDLPNVEWLQGSELNCSGPLLIDDRCELLPGIVAAGDVAAVRGAHAADGARTPHWASAVEQAQVAASALVHGRAASSLVPDRYFWTEQFELDVRICGDLPIRGEPEIVEGSTAERNALLQWMTGDVCTAAATVNYRMPITKLKRLAAPLRAAA